MNAKIFFQRKLKFGKRLIQLHHWNAVLFLLLSLSGFILFSSSFRSSLPALRVWVKDVHIWSGFIFCLPFLFYLPKLGKHLITLRKKKNHRINLYVVLAILFLLILSGLELTYHRQFPPIVSSVSLFVHDAATWFGVPYAIYHSVTRSRWFKKLGENKRVENSLSEPMFIDKENPVYKRRTFLKLLSGSIIAAAFLPSFMQWVRPFVPASSSKKTPLPDGNDFSPLPDPNAKSAPPIGGGRKGEFRYYTVTEVPELNNQNWNLEINGLVDRKKTYNWGQFIQVQRDVQVSDFHCVTGWSVYNCTWEGIPLKRLLTEAGIKKGAKFVKFYSADGVYSDTLTVKQAMMNDVMVAMLIDGQIIDQQNGGPVRLIIPKMYAYKSVKWLNRIELIAEEHTGYWEERGYSKNAWVKGV